VFDVSSADLDKAMAGILELRDSPGTSNVDPSAHGSGFDRVSAFQDGFDNGLTKCKDYRDDEPMVLELLFNDEQDAASGGDTPYDSIVNGVPYDLEDYWTQVYPEVAQGQAWQPVRGLQPFDPADPPTCGNQSTQGYVLFYCVPDDYVGWDNVEAMPSATTPTRRRRRLGATASQVPTRPASSSTTARIPARTTSHQAISTKASRRFSSSGELVTPIARVLASTGCAPSARA
jgi:hypothetical protein